ncbi:MAG: hypothetical protein P4L85_13570 [Paludisphaera borealis]|uniref:hypothetical protein n=1 Tax=Paludisphaera borealis TaxID=1387353 RepID=UPI00283C55EE|nr:hypothetical protein [Paludisphaera borealis]MDR3620374.1 hypothetical protein [Paludisphaera borealis]
MDDQQYVYATAAVMGLYFLIQVATKRFDPFAPVWLFFVGFVQVYVIQAISYRDWAISVRGPEAVAAANFRALWALLWFLAVYHIGISRVVARRLPSAPRNWSSTTVVLISPILIAWGLYCTSLFGATTVDTISAEDALLRSFPFVLMVGGILLITTGRRLDAPKPMFLYAGLAVSCAYVVIWMFNGKRSHSLIGVLATVCAYYSAHMKRPSWSVLAITSFVGALVVSLAIGWRNNADYERSFSGFSQFVGDFKLSKILDSLDIADEESAKEMVSYETKEYGGFLLMLDAVPMKSAYDYGTSYIRIVSTFIPRLIWTNKPLFGRKEWVDAWIASSELERDDEFTGPAIGILGATQLNGGAVGTLIVLAVIALFLRSAYDYSRLHADAPWVQFTWSIFFFNAWFMVVCDDPMVWFYFNWGFSAMPTVVLTWFICKFTASTAVPGRAVAFEDVEPAALVAAIPPDPRGARRDREKGLLPMERSNRNLRPTPEFADAGPSWNGKDSQG